MSLSGNEWLILAVMLAVFAGIAASASRISHAKRKAAKQAEQKRAAFKAAPPRQESKADLQADENTPDPNDPENW